MIEMLRMPAAQQLERESGRGLCSCAKRQRTGNKFYVINCAGFIAQRHRPKKIVGCSKDAIAVFKLSAFRVVNLPWSFENGDIATARARRLGPPSSNNISTNIFRDACPQARISDIGTA
jgi:hypothetical protein